MKHLPLVLRLSTLSLCVMLSSCHRPLPVATLAQSPGLQAQSQPNMPSLSTLYPLDPGHRWTYQLSQKQNGEPKDKVKTLQMWTEALATDGNVFQAVLRRGYPDSPVSPNPTLARLYNDRIELSRYQAPTLSDLYASPELAAPSTEGQNFVTILKAPFSPGQSWEGRLFKEGSETVKVIGWESVQVPAGTFQALKIEHHKQYPNGKADFLYYWYAPQVGMVKLYEELTVYYGQWLKYESVGELLSHTPPAVQP